LHPQFVIINDINRIHYVELINAIYNSLLPAPRLMNMNFTGALPQTLHVAERNHLYDSYRTIATTYPNEAVTRRIVVVVDVLLIDA